MVLLPEGVDAAALFADAGLRPQVHPVASDAVPLPDLGARTHFLYRLGEHREDLVSTSSGSAATLGQSPSIPNIEMALSVI
ncbi:hypothetical protein [Streptomyces sp. NPDC001792]|uniref:hypothetical protein n=1 Tax=unclassified Streptomyces TaxID=2593676 RepID=UPI003317B7D3